MTDQPLGQPVDRYTFRFDRFYPHPVTLVWQALTRAEHLDSWLSPGSQIDARSGGRFRLGFGGAAAAYLAGTIETFRPFRLLEYAFDNGERMCFELSAVPNGTRLILTHSVPPGFPDPDDAGTADEDAPNEAAPRRPGSADTGAVRALWRIVESIDCGRSDGRFEIGAPRRAVRVWHRPRSTERRDLPRSAPWDGRCLNHRRRTSAVHGEATVDANRAHAGPRVDPLALSSTIGAARALDVAPRMAVRVAAPRLPRGLPIG